MNEILTVLIIAAVVVLVLVRRFGARRIGEAKMLVIPLVIGFIGIRQGKLVDDHHLAVSTALLGAEMLSAIVMGVAIGSTMRLWREADGSAWSKGTKWTAVAFLISMAVRGGLLAAGAVAGIKAESGAMLVFVAAWLLAQNAVIAWRARELPSRGRASVVS